MDTKTIKKKKKLLFKIAIEELNLSADYLW